MALEARGSGIILPVYSLPSDHGTGTLGKAAYEFADFLKAAGQSYWQMLPLGPTSYGDSPYQSFSAFAGNPYFIDPDMLIEDGLLTEKEVCSFDWGEDPRYVDYEKLYESRYKLLAIAKKRGWERDAAEVTAFVSENEKWLIPYAQFMSQKKEFPDDTELYIYIQFLFYAQWNMLKRYVNSLGIKVIGDVPIYVAADSADVWAEPELFRLDSDNRPVAVAGVPPDYFSQDGQLWGNPLYDYEKMKESGYEWWIRRIGGAVKLFDVIRIDHFRGFESYWEVPAGEQTAKNGRWVKGPGIELVKKLTDWFSDTQFIAEDLGILTDEVRELLKQSGLPGMKVLEFAFDESRNSDYLPHKYDKNCVCYTGTHDNAPIMQWLAEESPDNVGFFREYAGMEKCTGADSEACMKAGFGTDTVRSSEIRDAMIRLGMGSVADTFICQMQDWLGYGEGSRTNVPGVTGGNWRWRLLKGEASAQLAEKIRKMTETYGR